MRLRAPGPSIRPLPIKRIVTRAVLAASLGFAPVFFVQTPGPGGWPSKVPTPAPITASIYRNPLHPAKCGVLNSGLTIDGRGCHGGSGTPMWGDDAFVKATADAPMPGWVPAGRSDERGGDRNVGPRGAPTSRKDVPARGEVMARSVAWPGEGHHVVGRHREFSLGGRSRQAGLLMTD